MQQQPEMITLSWQTLLAIVGTLTVVMGTITGAAVGYLTLFIGSKLANHRLEIMNHIDERFALKESMRIEFEGVKGDIIELKESFKQLSCKL